MRLFIAINFSEEMKTALKDIQRQMKEQNVRGNFTKPENLHLTLAFIGEYNDIDRVTDALGKAEFKPFSLSLKGLGSFGRLWWAGIGDSGELKKLAAQVRHHLADSGIPFDKKKFSPHITLIREPNKADIPELTVPAAEMTVESISLMLSERGRNGMIYTEIGSVECG